MRETQTERQLQRELDLILTRLDRHGGAADGRPTGKGLAGDLVEDAQAVEAQALSELSYGRLARRARTIRDALSRLQDGRYGRCENCNAVIPAPRLRAMPDATMCLACQEATERAGAAPAGVVSIRPRHDDRSRGGGGRGPTGAGR